MKIKTILSGEIMRPLQRKRENFGRAVAMKNNHKGQLSTKACSSLALELEGSQNLHTTSNCERLRLLEKFAILVVQSVGCHSSSTGLLFYNSNNLPVEEDPLHSTDERCSVEEDRCVKKSLRS